MKKPDKRRYNKSNNTLNKIMSDLDNKKLEDLNKKNDNVYIHETIDNNDILSKNIISGIEEKPDIKSKDIKSKDIKSIVIKSPVYNSKDLPNRDVLNDGLNIETKITNYIADMKFDIFESENGGGVFNPPNSTPFLFGIDNHNIDFLTYDKSNEIKSKKPLKIDNINGSFAKYDMLEVSNAIIGHIDDLSAGVIAAKKITTDNITTDNIMANNIILKDITIQENMYSSKASIDNMVSKSIECVDIMAKNINVDLINYMGHKLIFDVDESLGNNKISHIHVATKKSDWLETDMHIISGITISRKCDLNKYGNKYNYDLPDVGLDSEFIMNNGIQNLTGKTFIDSRIDMNKLTLFTDNFTANIRMGSLRDFEDLKKNNNISTSRTYLIPDVGADSEFLMSRGNVEIEAKHICAEVFEFMDSKNMIVSDTSSNLSAKYILPPRNGTTSFLVSTGINNTENITSNDIIAKSITVDNLNIIGGAKICGVDLVPSINSSNIHSSNDKFILNNITNVFAEKNIFEDMTQFNAPIQMQNIKICADPNSNAIITLRSKIDAEIVLSRGEQKIESALIEDLRANVFKLGESLLSSELSKNKLPHHYIFPAYGDDKPAKVLISCGEQSAESLNLKKLNVDVLLTDDITIGNKLKRQIKTSDGKIKYVEYELEHDLPAKFIMSEGAQNINGRKSFYDLTAANLSFENMGRVFKSSDGSENINLSNIHFTNCYKDVYYTFPRIVDYANIIVSEGPQKINGDLELLNTTIGGLKLKTDKIEIAGVDIVFPVEQFKNIDLNNSRAPINILLSEGDKTISGRIQFIDKISSKSAADFPALGIGMWDIKSRKIELENAGKNERVDIYFPRVEMNKKRDDIEFLTTLGGRAEFINVDKLTTNDFKFGNITFEAENNDAEIKLILPNTTSGAKILTNSGNQQIIGDLRVSKILSKSLKLGETEICVGDNSATYTIPYCGKTSKFIMDHENRTLYDTTTFIGEHIIINEAQEIKLSNGKQKHIIRIENSAINTDYILPASEHVATNIIVDRGDQKIYGNLHIGQLKTDADNIKIGSATLHFNTKRSTKYILDEIDMDTKILLSDGYQKINGEKYFTVAPKILANEKIMELMSGHNRAILKLDPIQHNLVYTIPAALNDSKFIISSGDQEIAGALKVNEIETKTITIADKINTKYGIIHIPELSTSPNTAFILSDGVQTLRGSKIFAHPLTISANSKQIIMTDASTNRIILNTAGGFTGDRIYTFKDVGKDSEFLMNSGIQTLSGRLTVDGQLFLKDIFAPSMLNIHGNVIIDDNYSLTTSTLMTNTIKPIGGVLRIDSEVNTHNLSANKIQLKTNKNIVNIAINDIIDSTNNDTNNTSTINTYNYTLPIIGNSEFVMCDGKQTINGHKTFAELSTSYINVNSGSHHINIYADSLAANRKYKIPDFGSDGVFVISTADKLGDLRKVETSNTSYSLANINFEKSTYISGNINKNGKPFVHDFSCGNGNNIFIGHDAGNFTLKMASVENVGFGSRVLRKLTTGNANTAMGNDSLMNLTEGSRNTAYGQNTASALVNGNNNVIIGYDAARQLTGGNNNILLGVSAGDSLTTESNNILIGSVGEIGDHNITRIGDNSQKCFVGGIYGKVINQSSLVYMNSTGQLGTLISSQRYKDNIEDINTEYALDVVEKMRPVKFTYKNDKNKEIQYGLIAEEVEKIDKNLCSYQMVDNKIGDIETVKYQNIPAILTKALQEAWIEIKKLKEENKQILEEIKKINLK